MQENDFFARLTAYLESLVNGRIGHVNQWLKFNTERFGGKAEVLKLFRGFESLTKELKAGVALCGSKCSSCGLSCVEHKLHKGPHECQTSHECAQICSFAEQHDMVEIPQCSMP